MEAAATSVKHLSRHVLPNRPHLLSHSPNRRYPSIPEDSRVLEEWRHRGLQYMTYLSDSDRGVLLTRPYFEMRDDPPLARPLGPSSTAAASASPASFSSVDKKASTKLSLSDYTNKQKLASNQDRRPDAIPTKLHCPVASSSSARSVLARDASRADSLRLDSSLPTNPALTEGVHTQDPKISLHSRVANASPERPSDRLDPLDGIKQPTTESEENMPVTRLQPPQDGDGDLADTSHPHSDLLQFLLDVVPKRNGLKSPARDKSPLRQDKSFSLATTGQPNMKGPVTSNHREPSPLSAHLRSNSTNSNHRTLKSDISSKRSAPIRPNNLPHKIPMPPLLSPLHLAFNGKPDSDELPNQDMKRASGSNSIKQLPRPHDSEELAAPVLPKAREPVPIPLLLSPTLPPVLEAELAYLSTLTGMGDIPPLSITARKSAIDSENNQMRNNGKPVKPSRVVTLKFSKRVRDFQRLMALQPRFVKDKERERGKDKAVNASSKGQSKQPAVLLSTSPARKRPMQPVSASGDTSAAKRQRTSPPGSSGATTTPGPTAYIQPPATPLKAVAAMARIGSAYSRPNTPADSSTTLTPGSAPPSGDRPGDSLINGVPSANSAANSTVPAKARYLEIRQHYVSLNGLARQLKHARDAVLKPFVVSNEHPPTLDRMLAGAIGIESIVAFMGSFRANTELHAPRGLATETNLWHELIKLIQYLIHERFLYRPLSAILLQLNALCYEELIRCHSHHAVPTPVDDLLRLERRRNTAWSAAHQAVIRCDEPTVHAADLGPWSSVDDVTTTVLKAVRSWASAEGVPWNPEIPMPPSET